MDKIKITEMINEFYAKGKPEAQSLMNLYSTIGKFIAKEENSSFVAELAKEITKNCASVKGFSARNLRRMRDFYITYSSNEVLLAEAKTISWTQNTVIMERCDSLEEMAFYVALVKREGLSKSELMETINNELFQKSKNKDAIQKVSLENQVLPSNNKVIYYTYIIFMRKLIKTSTLKYKIPWWLLDSQDCLESLLIKKTIKICCE